MLYRCAQGHVSSEVGKDRYENEQCVFCASAVTPFEYTDRLALKLLDALAVYAEAFTKDHSDPALTVKDLADDLAGTVSEDQAKAEDLRDRIYDGLNNISAFGPTGNKVYDHDTLLSLAKSIGENVSQVEITLYEGDKAYAPGTTKKMFRGHGRILYTITPTGWDTQIYDDTVFLSYDR